MICADSSFFVSVYLIDAHSPKADLRLGDAPMVCVNELNRTELAHALAQYIFRGQVTTAQAQLAWSQFEEDCAKGRWFEVEFPSGTWAVSVDLARRYGATLGVRTLDSLHVACALELGAERFWTFDERQTRLAEAAGLNTAA